jgi:flavodoxin
MKSLVIVYSYHHHNTEKIARAIATVLECDVKTPKEIHPEELHQYDLIGFCSGIYGSKHHTDLLDLVGRLPQVSNKNAFLFSTCGAPASAVDEGYVNDYARVINSGDRQLIERFAQELEDKTTDQLAVVTIQTTFPESQFSGKFIPPLVPPELGILPFVDILGLAEQRLHFRRQPSLFLLHPLIAHVLVLEGVRFQFRPIHGHMPQFHQTRLLAQPQHLHEQTGQRGQMPLAKLRVG